MTEDNVTQINFVYPDGYRARPVDSAVIGILHDEVETRLAIALVRTEVITKCEVHPAPSANERDASSTIRNEVVKIVESNLSMRPDHALKVATALLRNIMDLPVETKARFRIPQTWDEIQSRIVK